MELCGAQELIIIFDIKLRRCATAVPVNHKYVIKNCLDKTCLNRRKIREINADFIVRGLRNPADFEFEKTIAQTNKKLTGIETVFFLTSPETAYISSSIVREIIANKGDYTKLVPKSVRSKV